jgi:GNAT superfamily N-acetyltransferase
VTGMAIRIAAPGDAEAISDLMRQLGYKRDGIDLRLAHILAEPAGAVFVAESERVVGVVHVVERATLEAPARAEVLALVVDGACRGQGIGRRLMRTAEDWARDRGLVALRVRTRVARAQAHRFYEGLRYELVKEQKVYEKAL